MIAKAAVVSAAVLFLGWAGTVKAVVLWNDPDKTLVHETGPGRDLLSGAVKRDDSANDSLYFKFHVEPLSDKDTEEYMAAFELYEGEAERLAIGNALKAWAYSAFIPGAEAHETNGPTAYIDLRTREPEPSTGGAPYQYPRRHVGATIVFKIQYVPGEDDLVTVWLNPDLGPGGNEAFQPESITTRFNADASFDEIHLRHAGAGEGWIFSDLAIATSFSDFVDVSSARPSEAAAAGAGGAREVTFQSWRKEQGLPTGPLQAMAQTEDGYLWVGGDEGLARFDGLHFSAFGVQEGMKGGGVSALLADSQGALWIGTVDSGLERLKDRRLSTFTTREGLPANSITALAEDSTGRIWIGTESGLTTWRSNRLERPNGAKSFDAQSIRAICRGPAGSAMVAVRGRGVFQFSAERTIPVVSDGLDDSLENTHCVLFDRAGRLWAGAGDDFLLCQDAGRWHRFRIPRNMAKAHLSSLAEEPDGTIWAGSGGGGLIQIKEGRLAAIPGSSGLAGAAIESLFTDREGGLWVGTEAGLNRLSRRSLVAFSQAEGLGFGAVQGLAEVTPGVIWAAKANDGLYRWDGKSFSRLLAAGLSQRDSQITTLVVTRDGFCWVATTNSLLLYKDPIAVSDEVLALKPPRSHITALAGDRDGALWAGMRDGSLWKLRESNWVQQTNFSQASPVTALVTDEDTTWVGTDGNGLYRLKSGVAHRFDRNDALLSESIRSLYMDAEGTLWIGNGENGLSRWRNGRIVSSKPKQGLPNNRCTQILEDGAGRLWLGTGGGIVCVSKRRLDDLANGTVRAVYPQVFGRADGMLSEECSGGFSPAGLKTRNGLLWFSTLKGVAVINPRFHPSTSGAPNTVLEDVLIDGVSSGIFRGPPETTKPARNPAMSRPGWARLRITPGKHSIEFRYSGLSFSAPERMRFRYRLEGLDSDWVEAGARRTAFYSYLPPGEFRFRVSACNSDGAWTESEAGVEIAVLRYFWQTWWFIGLASATLLGGVAGAVRVLEKRKSQRRLKRLEQERALERERTRIAQDLHDEMGAKLCRISFLSEHARRGESLSTDLKEQIASISDTSREVLHSLDEIVWAVNPQNDTLEHVASYIGQYAQEYFQMTGIQCELDIPAQFTPHPLSSQIRHHLFLAAHEALTNILKHSGANRARVSMATRNGDFEIEISDNGKGLATVGAKTEAAGMAAGDGLSNMARRMAEIGGNCRMESTPGKGTVVRFLLPLKMLETS